MHIVIMHIMSMLIVITLMMWYVMLTMCLLSDRGCLHRQRTTDCVTSYISFKYFASPKKPQYNFYIRKSLTAAHNPGIRFYA